MADDFSAAGSGSDLHPWDEGFAAAPVAYAIAGGAPLARGTIGAPVRPAPKTACHPAAAAPRLPVAVMWLIAFAVAIYVASLPQLSPTVPGSELRLISPPLALLATALMLRPTGESAAYCLVYAVIGLSFEVHSQHFDFAFARIAIETVQTILLVSMLCRHFYARMGEPLMLGAWAVAVLTLTAFGALSTIIATSLVPLTAMDLAQELAGNPATAWRYWWLGNACAYLSFAGPVACLVTLRAGLKRVLLVRGAERRRFLGLAAAVLVASLIAFPIGDMSWLNLPPDVVLAKRLLPVPFAMAMAARFRANGAAVATLIFSTIAIASVAGPWAPANWPGLPAPATPTHSLLLITTTACIVIAGISRQLRQALDEAVEASQMKSRFIAMLNHELRTPLNAILGFSELMRLQNVRALDDAVGPIDNIHASGQRLLAMIEGLLSRADHGASVFDLSKQQLSVARALTAAAAELQPQLEELGSLPTLAVAEDIAIDADPRAFRQMLLVLLSYPLRFVGPETAIAVSAAHRGTDTVIEVSSSGLIHAGADDRDKLEVQLVNALALAHGARLHIAQSGRSERVARLTFFATRAAS